MKNAPVVTLKVSGGWAWIAVLDPASGRRGRYTIYRVSRWADKRVDVVGRELGLRDARKLVGEGELDEDVTQPIEVSDRTSTSRGWRPS